MTNSHQERLDLSYILPIRHDTFSADGDLVRYLSRLTSLAEVIVVDGSPDWVYARHHKLWPGVVHVKPVVKTPNGKVGGVLTGVSLARHDSLVVADEDVRYDAQALRRLSSMLRWADVVRPQNYFEPLPWHASWDTSRSLLNRLTGGDWPGTLGVRRSVLEHTGGYAGDVLFENLELVRTVCAAGGREEVPLDLYVLRRPPAAGHFWSQRVRQAYDEFARPVRCMIFLALLPLLMALVLRRSWHVLSLFAITTVAAAEIGRRRAGGTVIFPSVTTFFAPVWILERSICMWLALGTRLFVGGVRYHGVVLSRPATPSRELRRRYAMRVMRGRVAPTASATPPHVVFESDQRRRSREASIG